MIGQLNPTQLSSRLAAMTDQQLQQYAMLHHDDPFVMAIAMDVKNQRDALRSSVAMPQQQQQPTVVQQLISRMAQLPPMQGGAGQQMPPQQLAQPPAPQQATPAPAAPAAPAPTANAARGGLMSGVAALPARNLKRMAQGGIAGYAAGDVTKSDPKQEFALQYKDLAEQAGAELGVDPGLIISQWGLESGWGSSTVGKYNLGNIKDPTGKGPKAYDKREKTNHSYREYASPNDFVADYVSQMKRNWPGAMGAGSDPTKFAAGLQKGRLGAYASADNYGEAIANTFSSLVPSAQATEVAPAPGIASARQVAAYRQGVPLPAGLALPETEQAKDRAAQAAAAARQAQEEGFFGRIGSKLGLSEDTKRQLGQLNTAVAGAMGPAYIPRYLPAAASGIATLSERLYGALSPAAQKAKQAETAMREASAVRAAQAPIEAAEAAQMAGAMPGEAEAVAQGVRATQAARAAQVPSKAMQVQQAGLAREATDAARIAQAARTTQSVTQAGAMAAGATGPSAPRIPPDTTPEYGRTPSENWLPPVPAKTDTAAAAKAVDLAEKAIPAEKRKGMDWEDLMMFGFALMAGKSPRFLENVGGAGLAALQGKQEREKAEREQMLATAKARQEGAMAKYYEQYAGAIERGAKEKNDLLTAEKMVQDALAKWEGTMAGKMAAINNPGARAQEEARIRREIYGQLGLEVTKMAGATAAPADTGGFKVVGVRNP